MNEKLLKHLLANGLLTKAQADALRAEHYKGGKSILFLLREQGLVEEEQLLNSLSAISGIPVVRLHELQIPGDVRQMVKSDVLRKHLVLPLGFDPADPNTLMVAMDDPMNMRGRDLISLSAKCRVKPYLAASSDILLTIDRIYGSEEIKKAEDMYIRDADDTSSVEEELLREDVNSSPVVKLVTGIIEQAVRQRASDIHIEPEQNDVRVRYRVDGVLFVAATYDRRMFRAIITRVKIISGLDISEKRKPQDGRATVIVDGREYDIRVSVLPTVHGEKCVMRLALKQAIASQYSMKFLGFHQEEEDKFRRILKNPNGIVLVTGPTGSGKSRTLYTALHEMNQTDVNIVTVEDPVEINIDGINQVQVNPKAGLTFAGSLRSILRQDPDIIMIGEIRDSETAGIAVQASITGHLVLSTVHTNDTVSSINRMLDMGVEGFMLADSLVGIVAKRLLRCLCPHCKRLHTLEPREIQYLELSPEEAKEAKIYEPVGCQQCGGRGYYERIGVYEILEITPRMRELIAMGASSGEMRDTAEAEGMQSLRQSARRLVLEGQTTIKEMMRISVENVTED